MKNLILSFLMMALVPLLATAQTNVVANTVGVCAIDGNPNSNTDYNVMNQEFECLVMNDTLSGAFYVYDVTQTVGSRWVLLNLSAVVDTDTRLDNPRVVGTDLVFDILDVVNAADLGDITFPLSAIQDGVITGVSFAGTGNSRTYTITRSNGLADITGTIDVADDDADATNEMNTSFSVVGTDLVITDGNGSLPVPLASISPVQSVVGADDIVVTNAAGVYTVSFLETTSSIAYNAATFILNYTDEDGAVTPIDLSNLLQDFTTGPVSGADDARVMLSESTSTVDFIGGDGITVTAAGTAAAGEVRIEETVLLEFISNAAANTALGVNKKYKVSAGSTENTRGSVQITY